MMNFVLVLGLLGLTSFPTFVASIPKPDIYSLHILSDIQFRFATTLVTSRVANPAEEATEALFRVVLPNDAFITNFTVEKDGVIYPGIVKKQEVAKREYEEARRQGQNAGLVSQSPRATNSFKVAVNVAASSKVTFNLTYQELLQRTRGIYQHKIYVNPGQPVQELQIEVHIKESRKITFLKVPPIRNDILTNEHEEGDNSLAVIERDDETSAYITYRPTVQDQTLKSSTGLAGQFVVEYDIERGLDAGDVLVLNGYFVHYFAPDIKTHISKDILFILDTSGSMKWTKMNQLKVAMFHILEDLEVGDRFNIFTFESELHVMYSNLQTVSPSSISMAKGKVDSLEANGGTNIHRAVLKGVQKLSEGEKKRAPVIVFLTDGRATSGVTYSQKILTDVLAANKDAEIPIFTLAFGDEANWDLLNQMALQNNGRAKKIYVDTDADFQIIGFYGEMSETVLKNVKIKYLDNTVIESSVTRLELGSFYKGSELIVAGTLNNNNNEIKSTVEAESAEGTLKLVLQPDETVIVLQDSMTLTGDRNLQQMTEKIWAYMTIKELLNQVDSGLLAQQEEELFNEKALNLSLKYNFVTRLTSMVVTIPDSKNVFQAPEKASNEDATSAQRSPDTRKRGYVNIKPASDTVKVDMYAKSPARSPLQPQGDFSVKLASNKDAKPAPRSRVYLHEMSTNDPTNPTGAAGQPCIHLLTLPIVFLFHLFLKLVL